MGSLDSKIKNPKVNDISYLINKYPNIKYIFFNGSKAYNLFRKSVHYDSLSTTLITKRLPSSSPTTGEFVKSFEEKVVEWAKIKDFIGEGSNE